MKNLSRIWLFLAAVLPGLTLTSPVRADGLKLLPRDTEVIATLNLRQAWTSKLANDHSALRKQLQDKLNDLIASAPLAAEIKNSLGIDPFKDIEAVTVGMSDMTPMPKTVVIVIEGKFNPGKFHDTVNKYVKANPERVEALTIANNKVYHITPPDGDAFYLGLLNKNMLVLSKTKEGMSTAITPPAENLNKEMAVLVPFANTKKSLNLLMTASAMREAINQSNNAQAQTLTPFLKYSNGAVITGNIVSDFEVHLAYIAKDEATAKKMAEQINRDLVLVTKQLATQAETNQMAAAVLEILKTLKVSAQADTMTISGTVSRALVDQALKEIASKLTSNP
jgi:hypothetical protein